jgi:hypothetical protein
MCTTERPVSGEQPFLAMIPDNAVHPMQLGNLIRLL